MSMFQQEYHIVASRSTSHLATNIVYLILPGGILLIAMIQDGLIVYHMTKPIGSLVELHQDQLQLSLKLHMRFLPELSTTTDRQLLLILLGVQWLVQLLSSSGSRKIQMGRTKLDSRRNLQASFLIWYWLEVFAIPSEYREAVRSNWERQNWIHYDQRSNKLV